MEDQKIYEVMGNLLSNGNQKLSANNLPWDRVEKVIDQIEFEEGIYEGETKDGVRHGVGKYNFLDGERYEGEWVDGLMQGTGIYYESDGSKYIGSFYENERTGHGTYYDCDGGKYDGNFRGGERHGKGT